MTEQRETIFPALGIVLDMIRGDSLDPAALSYLIESSLAFCAVLQAVLVGPESEEGHAQRLAEFQEKIKNYREKFEGAHEFVARRNIQ